MKTNKINTLVLYGIISGTIYATIIAVLDYLQDKEFNIKKFILGMIIFGVAMIIVSRIRDRNKK
jgi:hypothetical protein